MHSCRGGNSGVNPVTYQTQCWQSIVWSPGFKPNFVAWWPTRPVQLESSPTLIQGFLLCSEHFGVDFSGLSPQLPALWRLAPEKRGQLVQARRESQPKEIYKALAARRPWAIGFSCHQACISRSCSWPSYWSCPLGCERRVLCGLLDFEWRVDLTRAQPGFWICSCQSNLVSFWVWLHPCPWSHPPMYRRVGHLMFLPFMPRCWTFGVPDGKLWLMFLKMLGTELSSSLRPLFPVVWFVLPILDFLTFVLPSERALLCGLGALMDGTRLTSLHCLTASFGKWSEHEWEWPQQLVRGHVFCLQKAKNAFEPANYRLVVLFSIWYRLWSSMQSRHYFTQLERLANFPGL